MKRSIVVIGTLDTKGDQIEYLKRQIEERGHPVCVIDIGVLGQCFFNPDIGRDEVARAAGSSLEGIVALGNANAAMDAMSRGALKLIKDMVSEDRVGGVVAVGGSIGTAADLKVMRGLPLALPKLIITTVAYSPAITPDMVGGSGVMMLPWLAGLWGLNSISKRVLETAAGVISGAAASYRPLARTARVAGVTSLGGTVNRYLNQLKPELEKRDYEAAVFHVTGMSGRSYEQAIRDGLIAVSLDLSAGVELLNHVCGGVCSAGAERMEAAGEMGIPQIVSPGAIEAFHWGGDRPLADRYRDRPRHPHNAILTTVMSSVEEMEAVGRLMARKLNKAKGPTAVVIPLKGFAPVQHGASPANPSPGLLALMEFRKRLFELSPVGLEAFRKALMAEIDPKVEVVALDVEFNHPSYVSTVLDLFDGMTGRDGGVR